MGIEWSEPVVLVGGRQQFNATAHKLRVVRTESGYVPLAYEVSKHTGNCYEAGINAEGKAVLSRVCYFPTFEGAESACLKYLGFNNNQESVMSEQQSNVETVESNGKPEKKSKKNSKDTEKKTRKGADKYGSVGNNKTVNDTLAAANEPLTFKQIIEQSGLRPKQVRYKHLNWLVEAGHAQKIGAAWKLVDASKTDKSEKKSKKRRQKVA